MVGDFVKNSGRKVTLMICFKGLANMDDELIQNERHDKVFNQVFFSV